MTENWNDASCCMIECIIDLYLCVIETNIICSTCLKVMFMHQAIFGDLKIYYIQNDQGLFHKVVFSKKSNRATKCPEFKTKLGMTKGPDINRSSRAQIIWS